jgi:hypothetical protein
MEKERRRGEAKCSSKKNTSGSFIEDGKGDGS